MSDDDHTRTQKIDALLVEPRRVCLEVRLSGQPPRRVPLERESLVIGRSSDADLQLEVEGVSRKHARVSRRDDHGYSLVDLGAKNGTWLNGARIEMAALHHGDRVQIGAAELTLSFETVESTPPAATGPTGLAALLSARELEVAEAVAEGLTNTEIAKRLGISRRTVATHLERMFERLGLHSRAALAHQLAVERRRG